MTVTLLYDECEEGHKEYVQGKSDRIQYMSFQQLRTRSNTLKVKARVQIYDVRRISQLLCLSKNTIHIKRSELTISVVVLSAKRM